MSEGTMELVRCEELGPALRAEDCFVSLCGEPGAFFLDSSHGFGRLGRFSFLGAHPFMTIVSRRDRSIIATAGGSRTHHGSPLEALRRALAAHRSGRVDLPVPFSAGAVGFLSYDLKQAIERLPETAARDVDVPDLYLAFYDAVLAFDHEAGRAFVTSAARGLSRRVRQRRGETSARRLRGLIRDAAAGPAPSATTETLSSGSLESNFTRTEYLDVLRRTIAYIAAGDIFQANISQRFHTRWFGGAPELFQRLRRINPAPFAAYLDFPGGTVLSSSPERFFRLSGRRVETRPVKGTRRRTGDAEKDRRAAAELIASEKDNAELAMIVDLERNDLGRVCDYGTVRVTAPRRLETYPSVFHLVATIEGVLHERFDLVDLLKAMFPGGSITGAPKIRAMEIIDELEPTARGVYTGSIGYIDFSGNADLNIAIRTMVKTGEDVYFQAGGGIVADSVPEAEYEETVDKARALIQAVGAPEWGTGD